MEPIRKTGCWLFVNAHSFRGAVARSERGTSEFGKFWKRKITEDNEKLVGQEKGRSQEEKMTDIPKLATEPSDEQNNLSQIAQELPHETEAPEAIPYVISFARYKNKLCEIDGF